MEPVTLTCIAAFHSSTGSSQNGAMVIREKTAALLIRTSIRPNASSVFDAIASTDASSPTSVSSASAGPCSRSTSSATRLAFPPSISAITGIAPWAAK